MAEVFYKETKKEKVGEVVEYEDMRQNWLVEIDGKTQKFTQEFLEHSSDWYMGEDCETMYRQVEKRVCANCKSEPLYDTDQQEYYCPLCEA